jgi:hypothetical protein
LTGKKRFLHNFAVYNKFLYFFACSREAELAIRELNNRPPYYFKVQFARSAAEKERIHKERENKEMMKRVLDLEPYKVHSEGKPFVPFKR